MDEALPSHQTDVVWSGSLWNGHAFRLQLAKVFLLKGFFQKKKKEVRVDPKAVACFVSLEI